MKTHSLWMVLAATMVLLAAGCRQQQTQTREPEPTVADTGADVEDETLELTATLTGAEERPGPGDEDGSGEAKVTLDAEKSQVCFELKVKDIDAADKAHIHQGAKGVEGPIVVTLDPPTTGRSEGCVDVEGSLLELIKNQPSGFYVNVHNVPFPKGAVRGQLS